MNQRSTPEDTAVTPRQAVSTPASQRPAPAAGHASASRPAPVEETRRTPPVRPGTPAPEASAAPGKAAAASTGAAAPAQQATKPAPVGKSAAKPAAKPAAKQPAKRTRKARLRLVQVDAWSVMKTAFLLSVALGIVLVVAVVIVWAVLGAAGVWDSVNSIVHQVVGSDSGKPFRIQEYLSTSRIMGITMVLAVLDVVLITAIATLAAFLYNLAATLLGGVEVTLAEDH